MIGFCRFPALPSTALLRAARLGGEARAAASASASASCGALGPRPRLAGAHSFGPFLPSAPPRACPPRGAAAARAPRSPARALGRRLARGLNRAPTPAPASFPALRAGSRVCTPSPRDAAWPRLAFRRAVPWPGGVGVPAPAGFHLRAGISSLPAHAPDCWSAEAGARAWGVAVVSGVRGAGSSGVTRV